MLGKSATTQGGDVIRVDRDGDDYIISIRDRQDDYAILKMTQHECNELALAISSHRNWRLTMTRDEIERTVYEAIEASQPVGPESAPAYFRRCDALAKKAADLILSDRAGEGGGYQSRVLPWMLETFGPEILADPRERSHRFLEEALELVQAVGCTAGEAHQLVDYTFGRPVGEPSQEVGGVMVCLAALCLARGLDMQGAAEVELARVWAMVDKIKAKHASKPKFSPLPGSSPSPPQSDREGLATIIDPEALG